MALGSKRDKNAKKTRMNTMARFVRGPGPPTGNVVPARGYQRHGDNPVLLNAGDDAKGAILDTW